MGCSGVIEQDLWEEKIQVAYEAMLADTTALKLMDAHANSNAYHITSAPRTVSVTSWYLDPDCTSATESIRDWRDNIFQPRTIPLNRSRKPGAEFVIYFSEYCDNALEGYIAFNRNAEAEIQNLYKIGPHSAGVYSALLIFDGTVLVRLKSEILHFEY